ncbi:MAG: hypothetical protein E7330_06820 [Clostridiales bacterium]|nr:hypothetical protein [Clostridiales bacterium]
MSRSCSFCTSSDSSPRLRVGSGVGVGVGTGVGEGVGTGVGTGVMSMEAAFAAAALSPEARFSVAGEFGAALSSGALPPRERRMPPVTSSAKQSPAAPIAMIFCCCESLLNFLAARKVVRRSLLYRRCALRFRFFRNSCMYLSFGGMGISLASGMSRVCYYFKRYCRKIQWKAFFAKDYLQNGGRTEKGAAKNAIHAK